MKDNTDLDTVLDLASIVSDNEGGLHDSGELDVAVSLMLPLELIQQSLVGGLRGTEMKDKRVKFVSFSRRAKEQCVFLHLSSK